MSDTTAQRYKFRIEPLDGSSKDDMLEAGRLADTAFDSDTSQFSMTYLKHPYPGAESRIQGVAKRLADGLGKGKVAWKAVRDEPGHEKDGEMAGFSIWQPPGVGFTIFDTTDREQLTDEQQDLYENVDLEGWNRLFGAMQESRKTLHGDTDHWYVTRHLPAHEYVDSLRPLTQLYIRPRRYLEILAIHPSYQRQGLGQLLLKDRLPQLPADQAVQLESTPAGQGLYTRFGFEVVHKIHVMGRDKMMDIPVMVKKPTDVA